MLNQDYKEMLSLLLDNKVKFLLVGAYALAVHGFPRATGDIDIFIKPEINNTKKLYKSLIEFGAPLSEITVDDFIEPGTILQLGVAPRRIDIITKRDGLTFEETFIGNDVVNLDGMLIPVISKQNLIKNKLSTGRDKDRIDAEQLKQC